MQFVFASTTAAGEALPQPGGGGDADEAARRDAALFGGEAKLLGAARALLSGTSLSAFLSSRERRAIAALELRMTVGDALALLASQRYVGAPLFDIQKRRFYSFVDVAFLLRAFITVGASCVRAQRALAVFRF
jgi:hypothetical protein